MLVLQGETTPTVCKHSGLCDSALAMSRFSVPRGLLVYLEAGQSLSKQIKTYFYNIQYIIGYNRPFYNNVGSWFQCFFKIMIVMSINVCHL